MDCEYYVPTPGRVVAVSGFKFIHAADVHLDSPLVGLTRYPGAPMEDVRGSTRRALTNLINVVNSFKWLCSNDLRISERRNHQTDNKYFYGHQS